MKTCLKFNFLFFLICLKLFFVSCKSDVKNNTTPLNFNLSKLKNAKYSEVLIQTINQQPLYISMLRKDSTFVSVYITPRNEDAKQNFFFSDTINKVNVVKYQFNRNKIRSLKSKVILENNWTYLKIDSLSLKTINLNDRWYFYFSTSEKYMGNAVSSSTVKFHLIDLFSMENFELSYSGENSFKCTECIFGEYGIDKKLKSNPEILQTLLNLSKKSKWIYQKTQKDDDIFGYLNYETKWNYDNNQENSFGSGHADIQNIINTTYYTTNLFDLHGEIENKIENENFIFGSPFRGNLIGFDKKKKLYFPVIIESCADSCNKEIEFVTNDSIKISYEFSENYTIAIKNIKFDSRIGK